MTLKSFAQSPEQKLSALKITLPQLSASLGSYVHAVRIGNLIFLSGKGPQQSNGEFIKGTLGLNLTIDQGYEAARIAGINQLAVLKKELGDLKKVKRVVKVNGFVNSTNSF
jgi:enamine deaminase RidA (YjgF/YER057c/UK114 family)